MDHSNKLLEFIRKPKNIISLIVIVGILVNVIFFGVSTFSQLAETRNSSQAYESKQQELRRLLSTPLPNDTDENEVTTLEMQVPETNNYAEIYEQLSNIAKKKGMLITSFSAANDDSEIEQSLDSYIKANDGKSASSSNLATPPADNINTVKDGGDHALYRELFIEISMAGNLDQLIAYTDELIKTPRLINVSSWGIVNINEAVDPLSQLNLTTSEINEVKEVFPYIYTAQLKAYVWRQSIVTDQPSIIRDASPAFEAFMEKYPDLADELEEQIRKNIEVVAEND